MSTTMEQVVSQLRAQFAAQSALADAVLAINNLATAQVRKDTPSLIDVNGFGRPKEFSSKEEDFQQWSKKTEAFFAGVIKEFEMMLEAAEQATESRQNSSIVSFCRLPRTRSEECKTWSLCCSRCIQRLWHSRVTRRTTVSPARRRTRWRHGEDCRSDMIRQQEEGNESFCARSFLLDGAIFWSSKQGLHERWESHVLRYEKKLNGKLDDEIRLAGLEALVPEELEKHLTLNSNRLRTFEDARLEIVTYVEAKFGLRICDSKPSDTGLRGHSDTVVVGTVNSLSSGNGKGSSSPRDGCFKCGGAHLQRDCNARKKTDKQSSSKGKQSKPWFKGEDKGKSKENNGKSKGTPQGTEGAKGSHKGKTARQVLKTRNQRQARKLRNLHKHVPLTIHGLMMDGVLTNGTMAGVLMNGMMTGVLLDGMKIVNKRTTHL